jgi:predicted MPP superfamily phosphohydrolase
VNTSRRLSIFPITRKVLLILGGLGGFALLCLGYAYFIEPSRLVVRHEYVAIKGWDPTFDGFRIAMIGDIHAGSNGADAAKLRRVVAEVNAEHPDLVVLLGDYISQVRSSKPIAERDLRMPVAEMADNLSGIQAPYGVLAVLGNHDGWYGDEKIAPELTRVGYRVLQNELFIIEREGRALRFFGLVDHMAIGNPWTYSDKARQIASPTEGKGDLVILEHSPDILTTVTGDLEISKDLKLFLAAHTHGGQIWLPILGRPVVPSSYGQKYAYGHIYDRGVDMWVTSGIGTSILPFRFMVPPEIVILTVKAA